MAGPAMHARCSPGAEPSPLQLTRTKGHARCPLHGGTVDDVELLFDLKHDRLGFFQVRFTPPGQLTGDSVEGTANPHRDRELAEAAHLYTHQPYPEQHASGSFQLRPKRHRWSEEVFSPCPIARQKVSWLFVWFRVADLFRHSPVIGFNVARSRACLDEFSAWNYASGNGSQDASGFGRLYADGAPVELTLDVPTLRGRVLALSGETSATGKLDLTLAGPRGESLPLVVRRRGRRWDAEARLPRAVSGRLRLYPAFADGRACEPDYFAIDVPARCGTEPFALSVLYDSPMCIVANHYTPKRLDDEMTLWRGLGVNRLHIQNYSNWPSFWEQPVHHWHHNYPANRKACGNYFSAAVRAAHRAGLEVIGDHKLFDLGFNCFFVEPDGTSSAEDIEQRHVSVIPELAAHQEWTQQANPAWLQQTVFPVARIRIHSLTPIPALREEDVRLMVSRDNRTYRPFRGRFEMRQGVCRRPHRRWTPAGPVPAPGSEKNHYVELSGLSLDAPFVSVQLGRTPFLLQHKGFMLIEAEGADGSVAACTLATNGSSDSGFFFWKGWMGWNNYDEPLLDERTFPGQDLGLVFREMPNMPTLLEPAYEGARNIWLRRLAHSLDAGADGVAIRTYCHHNGMMQYLKYAFAPPVREAFESLYGRAPRPDDFEDFTRIRRIRGDCFSEFVRAGSALARGRDRKFICILESGVEVPDTLDVRMHLPLDWRRWIREGLLDEIRLKYFSAENRFVHEEVLPLARRHGVGVHVTSRCLHTGLGLRTRETAEDTVRYARGAGFDGFCLYEQQNLTEINPVGLNTLKGPVRTWFDAANRARSEG